MMPSAMPLPGWPLLLRRELAAAYIGMSPGTFDVEWKAGRLPAPIPTTASLKAWHLHDLAAWAEDRRAAGLLDAAPNPWDTAE